MRLTLIALSFLLTAQVFSQKREKFVSLAVTNHHSAFPFSAFTSLFTKEFNPGIEAGYGFNWKTKPKHDWYQTVKAGYFYHRFVQHAIPLYTKFGYRYKLQRLHISAALGAGYLHSVPATAVLELQDDGTYKNAKGIGRGQALLAFAVGAQYVLIKKTSRPISLSMNYQQQVQTPFIKSYVPLLPYNSIALGVSIPLKSKN